MSRAGDSRVPTVTIVRTFSAPPAELFLAWTDASLLAEWLAPAPCVVRRCEADPRPKGKYVIEVVDGEGRVHVTTGEYVELVPGERIVLTWSYAGAFGHDPTHSLVTVQLEELRPGITKQTLTHAKAKDVVSRRRLATGWPGCFEKLVRTLASRTSVQPQGAASTNATVPVVTRSVSAPAAEVFAAFTRAEVISKWWAPIASTDPRRGGKFRLESQAGGVSHVCSGEYREFVTNERLVMFWVYDGEGPRTETIVTIEFAALDATSTAVTVSENPAVDIADSQAAWDGAIAALDRLIGEAHRKRIVLVRRLNAPLHDVYAAWTVLDRMKQWMGADVTADVRPGGRYRIAIEAGEQTFVHAGEYVAVEPEARIEYTFRAGPADAAESTPDVYRDERIEVSFTALSASETELSFDDSWRGEDLDADGRAAANAAWSQWLDGLTDVARGRD